MNRGQSREICHHRRWLLGDPGPNPRNTDTLNLKTGNLKTSIPKNPKAWNPISSKAPNPSEAYSRKLIWKPKKGPLNTTVPVKGGYMGFHVSLGSVRMFLRSQAWAVIGFVAMQRPIGGFPKIRGIIMRVPRIRTIVFWGLHWGPPI